MSLILPIGKKEADYKLSLRATVIDSDEVHSYVFLEVNVLSNMVLYLCCFVLAKTE